MARRIRWLRVVAVATLILYVGSYYGLSRRGFREADRYGAEGFYFVFPRDRLSENVDLACYCAYWPLVQIDVVVGTGRVHASLPLHTLSK